MTTGFTLSVKYNNQQLTDRPGWVMKALEAGGLAFQTAMREYPAAPPEGDGLRGLYRRTMTFGAKASYNVEERRVTFGFGGGSSSSGKPLGQIFDYLMRGTGIYGPSGTPITAKGGGLLSWVATAGAAAQSAKSSSRLGDAIFGAAEPRVFARSVRGSIWAGKLEETKKAIVDAVQAKLKEPASV